MGNVYHEIPQPGLAKGDNWKGFDELLYSEARYTQKGCTIPSLEEFLDAGGTLDANGEAIFQLGTLLAIRDEDGLHYPFGSPPVAGQPAEGLLRHDLKLYSGRRQQNNIVISGIAKLEKVHGYNQEALDQLGAVISVRRSTFKF